VSAKPEGDVGNDLANTLDDLVVFLVDLSIVQARVAQFQRDCPVALRRCKIIARWRLLTHVWI